MVDTVAILAAIPQALIDTALVELNLPRLTFERVKIDGKWERVPKLDEQGQQVTHTGKIMDESVVNNAFDAIKGLKTLTSRGNYKQTYVSLAAEIGADFVDQLSGGITQAIAAGVVKPWVNEALETEGLNINDPNVTTKLSALVGNFGIDQPMVDAVLGTGMGDVYNFPRLKPGHVQFALQRHQRGEI